MKPNVLLITTDQQRFDHLGVCGMGGIPTPHLDRLATEGIHFEHGYCSSPTCTPARLSLLTGLYPSRHGGWSIGVSPEITAPTLPGILGENGYRTAVLGKTHFVSRLHEVSHVAGLPFDRHSKTASPDPESEFYDEFSGPYLGFDYVQTCAGHNIGRLPNQHYRRWLERNGVSLEQFISWLPGGAPGTPEYDHHYCGGWDLPTEYTDSAWVGGMTVDYISKCAGDDDSLPWMCWTSFQDPHEPFVCCHEWYEKVDPQDVHPYPGLQAGEFDDRPEFYRRAAAGDWSYFDDGNRVPSVFYTPRRDARRRRALQATYAMIGHIDHWIGKILETLENCGQLDNTLIIFTSDHGEMHGHHGFWGKGLTAFDDVQRVPFLVWGPGLFSQSGKSDALVNHVDVPATVLDFAGIAKPQGMQGDSLGPVLRGESEWIKPVNETLVEARVTDKVYQQTLISDEYKLVVYDVLDEGELYDRKNDPGQARNLWDDPASQAAKNAMLARLVKFNMNNEGQRLPRINFA